MKINKNPAQAYLQGIQQGRKQGITDGFISFSYLSLLAMYNTNTEQKALSKPKFKEFVLATEKELNRIFTEEYEQDPESVAERAVYHINQLRKELLGVEKI